MTSELEHLKPVIEKVKKLLSFSHENATEHEVANATALAQKMLEKYQLTLADLKQHKSGEHVQQEELCRINQYWQWCLLNALTEPFGCTIVSELRPHWFMQKNRPTRRYNAHALLIGHYSDLQMVKYMWSYLPDALWRIGRTKGRKFGYQHAELTRFCNSFMIGAAAVIYDRLYQQRQTTKAAQSTHHALIVVKDRELKEYVANTFPELQQADVTTQLNINYLGVAAGRNTGAEIALNLTGVEPHSTHSQTSLRANNFSQRDEGNAKANG